MPDSSPSSDFSTFKCWSPGISVHNWQHTSTLLVWFEPYQTQETLALEVTWEWEMKWRSNVLESKDGIMHTILWNYEATLLLPGFPFFYPHWHVSFCHQEENKPMPNKSTFINSISMPFLSACGLACDPYPWTVHWSNPSGCWVAVTAEQEHDCSHTQQSLLE